jgi:translocation protein SEC63
LQVHPPNVLPPEPVVDDEISEPEEDSLAGQMAAIRRQQAEKAARSSGTTNKGKQPADSDSDSDDD